jgi:hypothetical protein
MGSVGSKIMKEERATVQDGHHDTGTRIAMLVSDDPQKAIEIPSGIL